MPEKTSLRIFIQDNYHPFAAMGVAGALTTLFTRFPEADLLITPSFLIFFVLGVELLIASWKIKAATLSLNVFSLLCGTILTNVTLFLIWNYPGSLFGILLGLLLILFGGIALGKVRRNIKKVLIFLGVAVLGAFLGIILGYLIEVFLLQGPLP